MAAITVRHVDDVVEVPVGTTALDALKRLEAIRGQVVAAEVVVDDGVAREWDLDRALPEGGHEVALAPVYADTEQGRAILRHSVAHLMAQAVTDLFPGAKWAIGPPIENGFYYDFDVERPFTGDDIARIEERMRELMGERQSFVREELSYAAALELFADQPYKREVIERVASGTTGADDAQDVPDALLHASADDTAASADDTAASADDTVASADDTVASADDTAASADDTAASADDTAASAEDPVFTVYRNVRPGAAGEDGEEAWVDLCRGPHIPSSERVPAFRLLRTAGAYWRGREDQPMLQRIYGTAWESRKAMQAHLDMLEEAAQRDHRKLGRELELTHFPEELGPGLSIFLPKGALVRKEMEDWIRDEVLARGYDAVYSPHIAKEDLWHTSGHLVNYAELMYPGIEVDNDTAYRLKPMNCPFHVLAYRSRTRSYRELPLRLSELGTVYRYEKSGVVNGQLRARGFTQDDSHIFCRPDQAVDEVADCVTFAIDLYRVFGLGEPSRVAVSTRPEGKSIGRDEDWELAERSLVQAVEKLGLEYELDPGEGAFYGPKIDIHARDAIGREWQLTTVQFDFNLPERFDITYVGEDGEQHRPYMVHRALFGSIERFFAVLLESTNGAFPTWLAPVQANVVPVAADFEEYAREVAQALRQHRLRVEVDTSDDTLGNKIRKSTTAKTPYTLVVGADEADAGTVAVRPYTGAQRKGVLVEDLVAELATEVASRGGTTAG